MGTLDGKVAIVTGAGRGVGRAEAMLLAQQGAKLVVNDLGGDWNGGGRDSRPAETVAQAIRDAGGEAVANFADVADWKASRAMVEQAIDTFGSLDILINNAGFLRDRMLFNMDEDDWDAVIRVHLKGHFCCTRHACSWWRVRSKALGRPVGGRIICTSSTSGLYGAAGQSNYGAAKAGIAAFAQIVSLEMARYGVTVNVVSPAARTRLTEGTFGPIDSKTSWDEWAPENVAPIVAYLVSPAAGDITGQVIYAAGGTLTLLRGWYGAAAIEKDGCWDPADLATEIDALFSNASRSYRPPTSTMREHLSS